MKKKMAVAYPDAAYSTSKKISGWQRIWKDRYLFLMLLPTLMISLFFHYTPMVGLVMAFQKFNIFKGIWGSEWVGFSNFVKIFSQSKFLEAIGNTLLVSALHLLICFPAPILLALLINELTAGPFKKTVQTISYLPHFLSWISVVGIVHLLFGRDGFVNDIRVLLGATDRPVYLAEQNLFLWFITGSTFWKTTGWGTVIHLANLSSISPELYEAASIDGANRLQKIRYITLPHMFPTVMILMIFEMGTIFNSNFELIYGLQNPYIDFEVINTIIYQTGIQSGNYSMATALGLAQGLVAVILVFGTNWLSKKLTNSGIM